MAVETTSERAETNPDNDVSRLTRAIERAAAGQQWDVVRMLARQLEALTRGSNVVDLDVTRRSSR